MLISCCLLLLLHYAFEGLCLVVLVDWFSVLCGFSFYVVSNFMKLLVHVIFIQSRYKSKLFNIQVETKSLLIPAWLTVGIGSKDTRS